MNSSKENIIKGFSKLSREEKIEILTKVYSGDNDLKPILDRYIHPKDQHLFNDISENVISNYYLPFSIAPNFSINGKIYNVPMVIEESSVVAAASKAASFWAKNGGFVARVIDTLKNGQIFFSWQGHIEILREHQDNISTLLKNSCKSISQNMEKRDGGIHSFEFKKVDNMETTFMLLVKFRTADSMGANFINSCLETMTPVLLNYINQSEDLNAFGSAHKIMAILSNYTPECLVECKVSCSISHLAPYAGELPTEIFADRFETAVNIAINDPYRATTHNKGIFNGIDAVILASGNDFRAIEAGAHAYAAKNGSYQSLTRVNMRGNIFEYTLTLPLALGTVGGLTNTHPMAKTALELLGNPSASELMMIAAAAGLANNFAAVASLVTTGIQKGHMKLHLSNLLNALNASEEEKNKTKHAFENKTVSYSLVEQFINKLRS